MKLLRPACFLIPSNSMGLKPVAQPVEDEVVSALGVFVSGDVGEADIIVPLDAGDTDFTGENLDFLAHGLGGGWMRREEREDT